MIPTYTFFAVDKGNMTLIQFPNEVNLLIDCHQADGRPAPLEYLRSKVRSLDGVAITHPHRDHLTGIQSICEFYKPKHFWHNGRYFKPDPVYDDWSYYEKLRAGKVSFCTPQAMSAGQYMTIGDTQVSFLGPCKPFLEGTSEDENNNCLILLCVTDKAKVIILGDTEEAQWEAVQIRQMLNASVLLASHHGRESGYCEKAIKQIKPQHVIISDGPPGDTDATDKYRRIATVSTTRERTVVVRPKH